MIAMSQAEGLVMLVLVMLLAIFAVAWAVRPHTPPVEPPPVEKPVSAFTPLKELLSKTDAVKFINEDSLKPPPPKSTRHTNRRVVPDRRKR